MGQVTVTLNGRTYRLSCGEGEEQRLLTLAGHVRERVEALSTEFGHAGDDRLLLMAALLVTDELFDARDRLMELMNAQRQAPAEDVAAAVPGQPLPVPPAAAAPAPPPLAAAPPPQAPPLQRPQAQVQRSSGAVAGQGRPQPQQGSGRGDVRQPQRGPAPAQRPARSLES